MSKYVCFSGSNCAKLEELGLSASTVLRRVGLPRVLCDQSVSQFKTGEYFALWQIIGDVTTNPAIGLQLGTEDRIEGAHPELCSRQKTSAAALIECAFRSRVPETWNTSKHARSRHS